MVLVFIVLYQYSYLQLMLVLAFIVLYQYIYN